MDAVTVAETVALIAATGGIQGLAEDTAQGVVTQLRDRIRRVFGDDRQSLDFLARACDVPDKGRVDELARAIAWHARRDEVFAGELAWLAREYGVPGDVAQHVRAGRDAYTAGRDLTVQQRPGEPVAPW